jgi:hypothetical protein
MCGIAGVRRLESEPVSRELLAHMAARLLHRGPGSCPPTPREPALDPYGTAR